MEPRALPIGPDGMYILRVEEPHDYHTVEQVAEGLARVLPSDPPPTFGDETVLKVLTQDAETLPAERTVPDRATVASYLRLLTKGGHFGRLAKTHGRKKDARVAIRRVITREWNFNQAVAALSEMRPTLPRKAGRRTAHELLRQWTQACKPLPDRDHPAALVKTNVWRRLLLERNIFPAEAARHAARLARHEAPTPTDHTVERMRFSSAP